MPIIQRDQVHLKLFISSFFNSKLAYLPKQKGHSTSSKGTVFSNDIISHSLDLGIF